MKKCIEINDFNQKDFFCLFVTIGLFTLLAFTLLSDFSFNLFHKTRFSGAFFDMWKRIIIGDVSIGHDVLDGECFIINHKTIPYFLPFPAMVRGFLSIFQVGEYPIISVLMGVVLYSISVYFLLRKVLNFIQTKECIVILRAWYPFFLLPLIALFVEASIYWEAIIWALALFITQAFLFISFLGSKKLFIKYLLLIVSSLILFTRPTYCIASCALVAILFFIDMRAKNYSVISLLSYCLFIFSLALLALLNYKRWGNPFEFAPLIYNEQLIGTERGRMTAMAANLSLERIPETLDYYFAVSRSNFSLHHPFISFGRAILPVRSYFDYIESYYSITLSLPFYIMTSLLGWYVLFSQQLLNINIKQKKYFKLYFFISIVPSLFILMIYSMALRYRSEFYVFFIFNSMIGIAYLQKNINKKKILAIAIFVTLMSFIFVVNGLFAERRQFFGCGHGMPQVICTWSNGA
jgi:hypothetical protein